MTCPLSLIQGECYITLTSPPENRVLEKHIRAHSMLCWLALLLVRVAENRAGNTWLKIRDIVQRVHLGEFRGENGAVWRSSELNPAQTAVFNALKIQKPPRIIALDPAGKVKNS